MEYFKGKQGRQFSFIGIPKILVEDNEFKGLSTTSKLVYGVLLERLGVSAKNGWIDDSNRAYVLCSARELSSYLNTSEVRMIDCLHELNEFGLIEIKSSQTGRNELVYIKDFVTAV